MQTATADPLVGRLLEGRYRILDRIARGGMSTVYAAIDERLDRRVAVKVMSSALSADPAFSDRFAREARAAARLAHVNAVAVYDQGHDTSTGGHHVFLVMELVVGRTLRDLIRERTAQRGRFTPAEAISIMEPVLSALSAAHRAGLVHRDVKPENILLSDDGLVKVADFGLARAIDADAASTRTGLMMGTVAYCAPEQIVHGRCDQRSDVYSAAIVLFELLTGAAPYQGDSAMTVAYQHVHSRVPAPSSRIKDRPSGVPTLIDEIVVAATDSDPSGRPPDASAFLAEVADARVQLALPVVPIPPRRRPNGRGVGPGPAAAHAVPRPPRAAVSAATTDVMHNRTAGRHDTEIVKRGEQVRPAPPPPPPPPPPVLIPPASRPKRSPRARRRRRRLIGVLVVLFIGALSVFGGMAAVRLYREWNTHIPKVAGYTVTQATASLEHTGYAVDQNITSQFSETVKAGVVMSTAPDAGERLEQGKTVRLVVSLGAEMLAVPDVSKMTLIDAENYMHDHGVNYDPTPRIRHSIHIQQGKVIATDPVAGKQMRKSDHVTFIVSSGPPMVKIPKISTDTSYEDADKALTKAHFVVSRVDENSDSVQEGKVISVDPSGRAEYGSTVTVTVSKGPALVTIPAFPAFSHLDVVQPQLEALGLHVEVEAEFGGHGGIVIHFSPGEGEQVRPGSTVTLTVI